jgi:quinol monooxygenase YgiN
MIKRLVKLTFKPENIADFEAIFENSKHQIRQRAGCLHLELLQDAAQENIFFTLSFWENETALEAYRNSELFKTTWAKTKILFNDKPIAWTTRVASTV